MDVENSYNKYNALADELLDDSKAYHKLLPRYKALEERCQKAENPFDVESSKITFAEIFSKWSAEKFPTISDSNVKGYNASYNCCSAIHDRVFKELKLTDLQGVIDTCGKNYC